MVNTNLRGTKFGRDFRVEKKRKGTDSLMSCGVPLIRKT